MAGNRREFSRRHSLAQVNFRFLFHKECCMSEKSNQIAGTSSFTDENTIPRRQMLAWLATGSVAGAALLSGMGRANAQTAAAVPAGKDLEPTGATKLAALTAALAATRRQRKFKKVPMILTHPDQWDSAALDLLLHYRGSPKQVWDNTDISSPWLNLMRNSINAQVWSFRNADFIAISATHGTCHLALYDAYVWEKYNLPAVLGHKFKRNTFLDIPAKVRNASAADYNDPLGLFSPSANCLPLLMDRGAVFLGCHNAIWEFAGGLLAKGHNPDHLTHEELAADLTNHLIPGVVLTPGIVATLPLLTMAGYSYAK